MKYSELKMLTRQLRLDALTLAIANQDHHAERCIFLARNSAPAHCEIYYRSATFAWRRATQLAKEKSELQCREQHG